MTALVASAAACIFPQTGASPDVHYNSYFPSYFKRMNARDYFEPGPQRQLATAAARGNAKGIEQAIAEGADLNYVGRNGMTPLYWAMGKQNLKGFQALLDHGANPQIETQMPESWRPPYESTLSLAVVMKHPDYLRALLDHGADPHMNINGSQETAVFRAIMHQRDENLRLLIERGANVNHQAELGGTPLETAVVTQLFGTANYLLLAGADSALGGTMRFIAFELARDSKLKTSTEFRSFFAELKQRGYIKPDGPQ